MSDVFLSRESEKKMGVMKKMHSSKAAYPVNCFLKLGPTSSLPFNYELSGEVKLVTWDLYLLDLPARGQAFNCDLCRGRSISKLEHYSIVR